MYGCSSRDLLYGCVCSSRDLRNFWCFKASCAKKLFDPCWDRRPVMKYVKQLHQCHSSSIQSFELLFSNVGGVPDFFCYLGAHAKIWNPATTLSGILVTAARVRRLIPKIVAYISCSAGRTHFARTNKYASRGKFSAGGRSFIRGVGGSILMEPLTNSLP